MNNGFPAKDQTEKEFYVYAETSIDTRKLKAKYLYYHNKDLWLVYPQTDDNSPWLFPCKIIGWEEIEAEQ